jgi:hypothetical protein
VEQGAESPWTEALKDIAETSMIPQSTFHLWFLYDLIYIALFSGAVVWLMKRIGLSLPWLVRLVRKTVESPWRCLAVFGSLHTGWYLTFGWESLPTDTGWSPNPLLLAYYLSFYGVGWMCFNGRAQLSTLQDRARTLVAIGVCCAILQVVIHFYLAGLEPEGGPPPPIEGGPVLLLRVSAASVAMVALSRGFAGLFMRYAGAASTRWRFISDSAYWVYLVHLPITFLVPALLIGWDLPMLLKFSLATLIVSAVCWLSYDSVVRGSALGRLLNGRTYAPAAWKASTIGLLAVTVVLGLGLWMPVSAEPISPWRNARNPSELLPDEEIGDPFQGRVPAIPRLNLASCIEVRGYVICPRKATYIQAIAACSVMGGTLATVETQGEATQIAALVRALTDESMYVGVSDEGTEGEWVWLDSTPLTYDPWADGQPDNHGIGENCVGIMWDGGEGWNDVPCSHRSAFICELDEVDGPAERNGELARP